MRPLRHIYRRPKLATHLQLPQFGSRLEHFDPTHVRPQYLWHRDAAIGILVVLQNRYQRTAYRQARSIERVHKFIFPLSILEAGLHATRLESLTIAH